MDVCSEENPLSSIVVDISDAVLLSVFLLLFNLTFKEELYFH